MTDLDTLLTEAADIPYPDGAMLANKRESVLSRTAETPAPTGFRTRRLSRGARLTGAVAAAVMAVLFIFVNGQKPASTALPTHVPQVAGGEGGSRTREFHSLDDLAADASAVLLVHGTGKVRSELISGLTFQVATVTVDRVLAGTVNGATTLDVHTSATDAANGKLILTAPDSFLLFVKPFVVDIGTPTGEWITSGVDTGILVQLTDRRYHTIDTESPDIPSVDPDSLHYPNLHDAQFFIDGGDIRPPR